VTANVKVNDNSVVHSVISHPFGVAINHPFYHEKTLSNPCQNTSCSHICALKASAVLDSTTYSCLCPIGYTILTDNATCVPTASSFDSTPRWCLMEFTHACKHEHACQNGGVCRDSKDKAGNLVNIKCECPKGYGGIYCEVELDKVNWELLPNGHPKVGSLRDVNSGSNGAVTTTIVVILVLVCFVFVTVYVVRRVDFNSRRFKGLSWNPAVLFRRRSSSQREHFVHQEEGVNSKLEKAESFSNPVYEDVRASSNSIGVHVLQT